MPSLSAQLELDGDEIFGQAARLVQADAVDLGQIFAPAHESPIPPPPPMPPPTRGWTNALDDDLDDACRELEMPEPRAGPSAS